MGALVGEVVHLDTNVNVYEGQQEETDMKIHEGGCLCGALRYSTRADPVRVTICHCRFCQRATGSAFLVEPIFRLEDFDIAAGIPSKYHHRSESSGKLLTMNFCSTCGTKIYLGLERFPDVVGVYGGTFDDPNWFARRKDNTKHIFLETAQHGTIIPPGIDTYDQHALRHDGTANRPTIFEHPHVVGPE